MADATPTKPVDVERLRALCAAATPGPWGWRGHDDGCVELEAQRRGGQRVVSAMRGEPCIVTLADGDPALMYEACASCRSKWAEAAKADDPTLVWESYRCPKPENLGTVWLWNGKGFVEPANRWAKRQQPYRSDVADVDHPDARFIAEARTALPALLDERDKLRAALQEMRDAFLESTHQYAQDLAYDDLVRTARLLGEPEPEQRMCEDCGERPVDPGEGICLPCGGYEADSGTADR